METHPIQQPKDQKASLKSAIPGPKSRALIERENQHVAPGLQRFAQMAGIVMKEARGSTITDVDGNTFIDIIGGIGVNGLGHSHPKFVEAVKEQVELCSVGSFSSEPRVDLVERIAKHARTPKLHRTQLYSSGAEAVESALRLAKCYTGKNEFVSFWGGFHGKTMGVLSLMGSDFKEKMGPLVPGNAIVPYAYCYRCPLKLKQESCSLACVELARKQIKMSTTGNVAAMIVEPMQGSAGNIIPPKDFLPAVHGIAKEIGALFIADEMITGFGRTGKYWATEHSGTEPDMITIGKQFGGGVPVSGIISRDEIVNAKPWSNPSGSSSSYGGNPLVSAAAATALRIIDEEGLVENSRRMGEYFLRKLEPLVDRYPFVGEVRGAGLFLAIEMVKDKTTREPLAKEIMYQVFKDFVKHGLLTMAYDAKFRIQPAMTIDEKTIDNAVAIITEVYDGMNKSGTWKS
ncbi:MAG TPA: aspartate aminotransferase family protein [Bdellovibrionales bacterium]|nr:MAG: aminotransferase class III [Bdellovibrionales bacterium GWB1_52_6]OFZ04072.1 MAG: aminotransferase class III [Bdellovibrionales bacterium GWA1_52_35]OFZ41235.1 MAG: aminotransferase class III [Bdellovibrionales bacterium GWC1_52_8]HAR43283.1 aspartate aminotransferase family protein [Bdellovibrionales bacterium]HCM39842.1 aspartate aminotransferase family protein [Bdellovibrionales bacterium]